MDYFSSDWHLDHEAVWRFSKRPFEDVEHMNNIILTNMFNPLKRGDNFFFIGDLSKYSNTVDKIYELAADKKIHFHWILGNHDYKIVKQYHRRDNKWVKIFDLKEIKRDGQSIFLSHYPMLTWNKSHYNSWLLYGHHHINSHGSEEVERFMTGKSLNVNCEFHNYHPWTLDEIKEYMKSRPNNWDYLDKSEANVG